MTQECDPLDPVARLLAESGDAFRLDAPWALPQDVDWSWTTLSQLLLYATALYQNGGPEAALPYLEQIVPRDFDSSGLQPLSCEALAEILNLWGLCVRRTGAPEEAIRLHTLALGLTRRPNIRQGNLYNCGYAWLMRALLDADPRRGVTAPQTMVSLRSAEAAFVEAATLDATDVGAWAQLGSVRLLLGQVTTLRIGKRVEYYRGALAAYERASTLETDPNEAAAMAHNQAQAQKGIDTFAGCNWLWRLIGRSDKAPVAMPDAEGFEPVPNSRRARG